MFKGLLGAAAAASLLMVAVPSWCAPLDRASAPLIWFGPQPPLPGRPGSTDFMDLFSPDADWPVTTKHTRVFSLFGEWVAHIASPKMLKTVVAGIERRGFLLAVEAGPMVRPHNCGEGYDGMAGPAEGRIIAERIKAAGGTIDILAYDEPFYNAAIRSGPEQCLLPPDEVARRVLPYVELMRAHFPDILLGGNEPLIDGLDADGIADWLEAYKAVVGEPLAFLHLDVDWGYENWPEASRRVAEMSRAHGVPFGIFYISDAPRRDWWVNLAGEHIKAFEAAAGVPDHAVFETWTLHPDRVLPESDDWTFTGLVRRYVQERERLGFRTEGPGGNLAYRRATVSSHALPGRPASNAVDGEPAIWWSAGAPPPAWIEVRLDEPANVAEIRLTVSQSPPGDTRHIVSVMDVAGRQHPLTTLDGYTSDGQVLLVRPQAPLAGITAVRIETVESPSWVAWHEIEIIAAD